MKKLINGKRVDIGVRLKDLSGDGVPDAAVLEVRPSGEALIAAAGVATAALDIVQEGRSAIDLLAAAIDRLMPGQAAGWNTNVAAMPRGGYVDVRLHGGDVRRVMKTWGDAIYDVKTGDRVDVAMIAAWKRA